MFWVVQIGALASMLILLYFFRKETTEVGFGKRTKVTDYFPTVLLVGAVLLLILASFIPNKPAITNGVICIVLMTIGIIRAVIKKKNFGILKSTLMEIDYETLLLLAGLFVVIGGITEVGVVDDIAKAFVSISGDNLFLIYSLLVWASVLFSAFIDNIPYIATMLPVTANIAVLMGVEPYLLYFGLLCGATLGGNLTPIGASANITALGILKKEGYEVATKDFMKLSIPFTLSAVITGYLLVWFLWA